MPDLKEAPSKYVWQQTGEKNSRFIFASLQVHTIWWTTNLGENVLQKFFSVCVYKRKPYEQR